MNFKIKLVSKISLCLLITSNLLITSVYAAKQDPVDYINPMIGTNGQKRCGRTLPEIESPVSLISGWLK